MCSKSIHLFENIFFNGIFIIVFIINNEQLKQFYRECQKDKYIGIDTEFFWTQTYEPKLCLIQIANKNNVCLIDPIKYNLDLNFIKKLLLNKKIKKILHSSSQDLRIFFNLFKVLPVNIFDTQIGVLPLGYNNSVSLKQICLNFLNSHRLFNNLVVGFDNEKQYEDFLNCNRKYKLIF